MKTKRIKSMKILSPGTFKSANGKDFTFTEEQLVKIAQSCVFSENENAPPVVLSHNKVEEPRYGWVDKAWIGEDKALYCSAEVEEALFSDCEDGKYPNRSVGIDYANMKIEHLAILGAQKPAIKNLGLAKFSENSEDVACFSAYVAEAKDLYDIEDEFRKYKTQSTERTSALEALCLVLNSNVTALTQEIGNIKKNLEKTANFSEEPKDMANVETRHALSKTAQPENNAAIQKILAAFSEALPKGESESKPANAATFTAADFGEKARAYIALKAKDGITVNFSEAVNAVFTKGE
jgi:hypothetical protein